MKTLLTLLIGILLISGTASGIQPIGSLGKGELRKISFLPDGTILRVLSNRIEIADPNTNATMARFAERTVSMGETTVSSDGSRLAIVTYQRSPAQTVVEVWGLTSRHQIRQWTIPISLAPTALSPDLTMLAGYAEGDIYFWDTETGAQTGKIEWMEQEWSVLLAFNSDGQQLLTSRTRLIEDLGWDKTWGLATEIWDVATHQRLGRLDMPDRVTRHSPLRVMHAVYSPNARWLVTGDTDHRISLWNARTKEEVSWWNDNRDLYQLLFSNDSRRLYAAGRNISSFSNAGGKRVRIWDVETGELLSEFSDEPTSLEGISISPDEKLGLLQDAEGYVGLWDIQNRKRLAFWTDYILPTWGELSPDGRTFVTLRGGSLTLWNLQSQSLQKLIFPDRFFRRIAMSPDGQTFAVDEDPWIEIRSTRSGNVISKIPNDVGSTPFVFSSNGRRLAFGQTKGLVIADLREPEKQEVLQPNGRKIFERLIAFSDDDLYLAVVDWDEEVHLWERRLGGYVYRYSWRIGMSSITSLEFAPIQQSAPVLLIGGDFGVQMWELGETEPEQLTVLKEASAPIQFIRNPQQFTDASHRRDYLLINQDNRLQIWDWTARKPMMLTDVPPYFAANRDGSVLLTWDYKTDQTQIWNIRSLLFLKPVLLGEVKQTALLPNFPNPFNPETWIPYQLGEVAHVRIQIYDVSGRLVRNLDLGEKPAGSYMDRQQAAYWNGRNGYGEGVSSGVYFYTLEAGNYRATRRMSVMK